MSAPTPAAPSSADDGGVGDEVGVVLPGSVARRGPTPTRSRSPSDTGDDVGGLVQQAEQPLVVALAFHDRATVAVPSRRGGVAT